MKLLNFLGAIGLMLGATTNIHNIRPNVLKSQSRQVQRANSEYFEIETEYSIIMDYIQANVFNSYDFVVFDLQNGELWQTDGYVNQSEWVQDDISKSLQALHFDDYHNYLISRGANYDYAELEFKFSLGSQSQYQDNYIGAVLFTLDENNNFVEFAKETFNHLSPYSNHSVWCECDFQVEGVSSLNNLYLAFEYWSPDRSVGNIKVSLDTDIYLENSSTGETITDILNNTYNYFIFTNNWASSETYHQAYNDGYRVGFNESQEEIEGLEQDIVELSRELELTKESAETIHNLWMEAESRIVELENVIESSKVLQSTFEILTQAFNPVIEFFKIQITPNINIGSILLIPVSVAIILFLLKALIL